MKITAYKISNIASGCLDYCRTKAEAVKKVKYHTYQPFDEFDLEEEEKDYTIEKVKIDLDELVEEEKKLYDIEDKFEVLKNAERKDLILWFDLPYLTNKRKLTVDYIANIIYAQIDMGSYITDEDTYHRQVDLPGGIHLVYNPDELSWTMYDNGKQVLAFNYRDQLYDITQLMRGGGDYLISQIVEKVCNYLNIDIPQNPEDLPF